MSEQQLNGPNVGALLQEVDRKGMSQRVWRDRFGNFAGMLGLSTCVLNRVPGRIVLSSFPSRVGRNLTVAYACHRGTRDVAAERVDLVGYAIKLDAVVVRVWAVARRVVRAVCGIDHHLLLKPSTAGLSALFSIKLNRLALSIPERHRMAHSTAQ
jgi:hypothetical protein